MAALLDTVEARDDLLKRFEEEFDRELLEQAMARVRLRVQPHTWEAFRLLALEGLSGAEAAARLGMKVGAVFVAKSKVRKMLEDEIRPAGPRPVSRREDRSMNALPAEERPEPPAGRPRCDDAERERTLDVPPSALPTDCQRDPGAS